MRPFIGAWAIWLGGYAALLAWDLALRAAGGSLSRLQVSVGATVLAGAACGFFLAAAARWSLGRRLALIAVQAPAAYMAAVMLATAYLCLTDVQCP